MGIGIVPTSSRVPSVMHVGGLSAEGIMSKSQDKSTIYRTRAVLNEIINRRKGKDQALTKHFNRKETKMIMEKNITINHLLRLCELAELGLKYKPPVLPHISSRDRAKALDDLKKLSGLPPYDDGGNICRGDGYFANSLVRKYGMSIEQLEEVTGFKELQAKWNRMRQQFR